MLTDGTTTRWGRRRSGGLTGLQNQLARLNPGLVGSIPTRSRHMCKLPMWQRLRDSGGSM